MGNKGLWGGPTTSKSLSSSSPHMSARVRWSKWCRARELVTWVGFNLSESLPTPRCASKACLQQWLKEKHKDFYDNKFETIVVKFIIFKFTESRANSLNLINSKLCWKSCQLENQGAWLSMGKHHFNATQKLPSKHIYLTRKIDINFQWENYEDSQNICHLIGESVQCMNICHYLHTRFLRKKKNILTSSSCIKRML